MVASSSRMGGRLGQRTIAQGHAVEPLGAPRSGRLGAAAARTVPFWMRAVISALLSAMKGGKPTVCEGKAV